VVQRLEGLDPSELDAVRTYELGHRARRTVLNKADQLRAGRANGGTLPQGRDDTVSQGRDDTVSKRRDDTVSEGRDDAPGDG
jgi:hypothetical protein